MTMLSATNLITNLTSSIVVETEIFLINLSILNYVSQTPYEGPNVVTVDQTTVVTVNGSEITGTPMTLNTDYYGVWQGSLGNNYKISEMKAVIDYYTKLGYTINRKSDDGVSLYWLIGW
jgi:hypothetical protein